MSAGVDTISFLLKHSNLFVWDCKDTTPSVNPNAPKEVAKFVKLKLKDLLSMRDQKEDLFQPWARVFLFDFCCTDFPEQVKESLGLSPQEFAQSSEEWSKYSEALSVPEVEDIARPSWRFSK